MKKSIHSAEKGIFDLKIQIVLKNWQHKPFQKGVMGCCDRCPPFFAQRHVSGPQLFFATFQVLSRLFRIYMFVTTCYST